LWRLIYLRQLLREVGEVAGEDLLEAFYKGGKDLGF
jgi:hypothetical protein